MCIATISWRVRIEIDATFVISMDRATERRGNIAHQFERLAHPVPYSIWPAVDGRLLDLDRAWPREIARRRPISNHPYRAGVIGCFLSYITLFRRIQERGLRWSLVLEDDFAFCDPQKDIRVLEVDDGAEIVSLDRRMNRRGLGTLGTVFSLGAIEKLLPTLPARYGVDLWMAKRSFGFIGGTRHERSRVRCISMDTTSYAPPRELVMASSYQHDGIAVAKTSYIIDASGHSTDDAIARQPKRNVPSGWVSRLLRSWRDRAP